MAFRSDFYQSNIEGLRMSDSVLRLVDGDDVARCYTSLEHAALNNTVRAQAAGSDGVKGVRIEGNHVGLSLGRRIEDESRRVTAQSSSEPQHPLLCQPRAAAFQAPNVIGRCVDPLSEPLSRETDTFANFPNPIHSERRRRSIEFKTIELFLSHTYN